MHISVPWGKYEMQVLPMGLCNGPDIFQEKMSDLFLELEYVRTYINNLLVTTKGGLDDHLEKLDIVLAREILLSYQDFNKLFEILTDSNAINLAWS